MTSSFKRIVIIGGGVGGLELATSLGRKLRRSKLAKITLVDCNYRHLWKPLLHKVATGSLDEEVDAISYIVQAHNYAFQFQLGYMSSIDREQQQILIDEIRNDQGVILLPARRLDYDILVVALGSISNDFDTVGVKEHCIFLDSLYQARRFHNKMLNLFFRFFAKDNCECESKINIAIVGGGATGVELSAELYNTVQQLHNYGFTGIDNQSLTVTLIEASERILPALPQQLSAAAHQELTKLGVKILTNIIVTNVDKNGLHTKDGMYLHAELMVWTAGIKAPSFMKNIAGLETNHINQLVVKPTLQTTRDRAIFAIGDCASCLMPSGNVVPPRAQAAHQMASRVYSNILALLRTQPLRTFNYKDHGSLISLSRFRTFGVLMGNLIHGSMMIEGYIARVIYILLYRMHQITLHGYIKTGLILLVSRINRVIRPHLKLH